MLGTTLPTPLYPLYKERFEIGEALITIIFAVYAVGVLSGLLLFGRLSDQIGRRSTLSLGLLPSALSAIAFLVPGGLATIFAGRVLSGLSAGIFTGTATVTLVELAPPGWEKQASLVAAAVNMGGLGLGSLLAGTLAEYAPKPLTLSFAIDLALVVLAGVGVWLTPEPVEKTSPFRLKPQRLHVPKEVRSTFVRAATAGFAGFCVMGLFGSVSPAFLAEELHRTSHTLSGLVVFSAFAASIAGQFAVSALGERRALLIGCVGLSFGMVLVAVGLLATSLVLLLAGAIMGGLGQGMCFRAGLDAITDATAPAHRAAVASSFFVVLYLALSLPVIGVGFASQVFGLVPAGTVFAIVVALIAVSALIGLMRHRT